MRYDLSRDVVGLNMYKRITEREANPLAERVLNRGEATVAPRGRADDFAWPRSNTSGEGDMEPTADAVRPRGSVALYDTVG